MWLFELYSQKKQNSKQQILQSPINQISLIRHHISSSYLLPEFRKIAFKEITKARKLALKSIQIPGSTLESRRL